MLSHLYFCFVHYADANLFNFHAGQSKNMS